MTVWCLDQSEVQDQSEEKERTSAGFLSSGRKANLSQLELDDIFEEELEINSVVAEQQDPTEDLFKSEITLENEFVSFPGVSSEESVENNLLDFDFEETGETVNPIVTVGLAATSRPRNMRPPLPLWVKISVLAVNAPDKFDWAVLLWVVKTNPLVNGQLTMYEHIICS